MLKYSVALLCLAASCTHGAEKPDAAASPAAGDALASFEVVRTVLQSPRCVNCHPAGDAPTQGDELAVHAQNVQRGPTGNGLPGASCATCHGTKNPPDSYGAHMPPGVSTGWRLPPQDTPMVFAGLSSPALCAQLKDRRQTGGKDLDGLLAHVDHDPLVMWGWSPGFGRRPVETPHAEFLRAFKTWVAAGAPCAQQTAQR